MTTMQGWTNAPSGRGTYDIIWSCFTTIFLALYTMLHVNVKGPEEGCLAVIFRKTRWLALAVLAPELLMLLAGGQWASAKRSVADMKDLGKIWTMKHAFYADSGGFVVEVCGTRYPVTAKQLHYLVQNSYITMPKASTEEIWDKSKADTMAKALMCLQTAWFVMNCILRAITHLPVTPIELATTALVSCSAATYFFWWHKPLNVESATLIATIDGEHLRKIQQDAASKDERGSVAPFDCEISPFEFAEPAAFISRSWHGTLSSWIYKMGLQKRVLTRLPNDRDPRLHTLPLHIACGIFTALFSSLHFFDWNFPFPTHIELLSYRVSCCIMEIVGFLYGLVEVIGCYVEGFEHTGLNTLGAYKKRWPACMMFLVPAGLYLGSRLLLIGVVLASLRSLPTASYDEVDWGWLQYLPHI